MPCLTGAYRRKRYKKKRSCIILITLPIIIVFYMKYKGRQPVSVYTVPRMPGLWIYYEEKMLFSCILSFSKYSSQKASDRRRISRANGLYTYGNRYRLVLFKNLIILI